MNVNYTVGLTDQEAQKKLDDPDIGPNKLDEEEEESLWEKIKE